MTPFDFLRLVHNKKIKWEDLNEDEQKTYNKFIINRALGFNNNMLDIVKKVHATMVRQAKPINIVNTLFIQKDYNVFLKDVQKDLNKQNIKLSINKIKKFDMFFRKKFIKKTYQLNKNTIKELN